MTRSTTKRVAASVAVAVLFVLATAEAGLAGKPKIKQPPKLKAGVTATGAVSLVNAKGAPVKQLAPGWYTLTIADDSHALNFHILGPGVNHAPGIKFRGVEIWGLHVRKGVYEFRSDPGARKLKTFRVLPKG